MSGSLYIWIIGAFFVLTVGAVGIFTLLLWLGHMAEKRETGSKRGFLELPEELRATPEKPSEPASTEPP